MKLSTACDQRLEPTMLWFLKQLAVNVISMSDKLHKITNLVLFKVGWISCVLLGASQYHLLGTGVVVVACAVAVFTAKQPMAVVKLIGAACLIGIVWETVLIANNLLEYRYGQILAPLAPHWIVAMWALFASTIDSSMAWLKKNLLLASVFGAIGGPMAFFAGQRLGAVVIPNDLQTGLVLAVGWAILTPSLLWMNKVFTAQQQGQVNNREFSLSSS